jgi:HK97 family phage major capsid protein
MSAFDRALDSIENQAWERMQDIRSMRRREDPYKGYSLARAIDDMAHERRGLEREVSKDLERTHPTKHGGIVVPWSVFTRAQEMTRADIVGTTSAGGYLVDTQNVEAADALRPNMVCGGLGATFVEAERSNINLPRLTGVSTAYWMTAETMQITEVEQQFGQIGYSPKTVGAYTEYSRLLDLQGGPSPTEFVIRRDVVAVVARAFDKAALFGTGVNGQPLGLANNASITTFSGTSMSLTSIANAAVALGDGLDDSAGVAANRTTAGLLKTRQEASGSTRLLWEGSLIAGTSVGFPARSSTALASGAYILGSWRYLNLIVWGGGIEVMTNPYGDSTNSNFKKGLIGVRAFLTCDAAPTFPSAFNYAASVT